MGSTVALADGTGTVQTEYTYEPFGAATVTGTSSTNPYQFTGRENDGTGLLYYRARYYSPVLQRFISEDPIGFAGGDPNLYAYVGNNPTNYTDPSGLFVFGGGYGGTYAVGGGIDVAGGVVFDSSFNVGGYAYAGGSVGPQFAGTGGRTGFVAPFADTIADIQGPSVDIHIRLGIQATISVPVSPNPSTGSVDFNFKNTSVAVDWPPGKAFGIGAGGGYTKIRKFGNIFGGNGTGGSGGPGGPGGGDSGGSSSSSGNGSGGRKG